MKGAHRRYMAVAGSLSVALALAGCAAGAAAVSRSTSVSPGSSVSASASGSASASASGGANSGPGTLTVQLVTAHILQSNPQGETYKASGHWLYPNDLNDTIVYDGKVVVHGHPGSAALSHNGLHYAYTLAGSLSVYVDGRVVATGTYIPDVFDVSDDGSTVLYSDSHAGGTSGVIYRNGIAVFHAPYSIGEAVGSADAMHYTAVVNGFPARLVHDGTTVASDGITGFSFPMISPDGTNYGAYSPAEGAGTSVDGITTLPATEWGTNGEVTDQDHWAIIDIPRGDLPLVDGVVAGAAANQVVISDDGREVATDTNSGDVLVNGVKVANVPIQTAWLEIEGTTLYVYSVVV